MTVQNTIVKNVYVGNGSTTIFPFTFECNKAEHIQAFVKDAAGNISSTTNFKVDLEQKNLTYPNTGEPLAKGDKLIILRQLPLQQLLNLLNQGPFYAEDIEETFDEVVMMLQQMTERIGRSLAVSVDIDAENSFNTIIPLEAGKTFRVKDDGTGFEVTEDPGKVIDGAKALLKQTMEQAEFANEQAVNAQNAANEAGTIKDRVEYLVNGNFPYVIPEMFGAVGDGVTDDTEAIQNALNASHVVIFGEKTYLIDGNHTTWGDLSTGGIQPNSDTTLIMCNGTTLKAKENTTGFYHTIYIREGVDNVTIYGGKIKCYKDNLVESSETRPQGYGIYIKNSSNVSIIGTEIYDAWGDGIMIDCLNTHHIRIEKCNIHDCRRQGISIIAGADITIRDAEIFKISGTAPQSGIDIEPSYTDHYVSNVLIDNVYFHENAGASCYYSKCKNVTFTNCICSDGNMQATGEVSSVCHYSGRYKTVKIDKNSEVNFYDCVITGFVSIDAGICELHNCTIYDFNPNADVSCNINVNGSNTQSVTSFYNCNILSIIDGTYSYFVWGKGICKFFGCKIKTQNENGMTNAFSPFGRTELQSCEVNYIAKKLNSNMCASPNMMIIKNSHIKSNSNIGFAFDPSWETGNVFFANNIFDFPQWVVLLVANMNPTDYIMTFVNNIRTSNSKFLYDNGNTFAIEQINNDMVAKVPSIVD